MTQEERFIKGENEEALFSQMMNNCSYIISCVKTDKNTDREKKIDFICNYKSPKDLKITQFSVDIKSASDKNPEVVNISHTARNGNIGSLPASYADFPVCIRFYCPYLKVNGFHFILKDYVWDVINLYGKKHTNNKAVWWEIPIIELIKKRSLFISLDGTLVKESKWEKYNKIFH